MKDPRQVFEAVMRGNGYADFRIDTKGNYLSSGLQTRWKYFLLGWEMRGLK
jgi:hypothetical protein